MYLGVSGWKALAFNCKDEKAHVIMSSCTGNAAAPSLQVPLCGCESNSFTLVRIRRMNVHVDSVRILRLSAKGTQLTVVGANATSKIYDTAAPTEMEVILLLLLLSFWEGWFGCD